jgi:hypothetical protein
MAAMGHTVKRLMLAMSVLLPFWLSIGRGVLFNVEGWSWLYYLFVVAPILLLLLLGLWKLISLRPDVRQTGSVSVLDAVLLPALWAAIFLHGFFAVDSPTDNIPADLASVATRFLGHGFLDTSDQLATFFFWASAGLLLVTYVVAIGEQFQSTSMTKDPSGRTSSYR